MKKPIIIGLTISLFLGLLFVFSSKEEKVVNNDNYMDYTITLQTTKGDIKFKTFSTEAPSTVLNFVKLAKQGFYDGLIFHRVIDGFMIQGGDPSGDGTGGPGYTFEDEINPESEIYQRGYVEGVVAMANAGPNTQGSQFFIMVADNPLPPAYTIFGEVFVGRDVAKSISQLETGLNDKPFEDVVIKNVFVEERE